MQVKQDFQLFTFSEKPNGISMILEPFWALFACDGRTNERTNERTDERRTERPRQAPPRAVNSQPVKGPRSPTPINGRITNECTSKWINSSIPWHILLSDDPADKSFICSVFEKSIDQLFNGQPKGQRIGKCVQWGRYCLKAPPVRWMIGSFACHLSNEQSQLGNECPSAAEALSEFDVAPLYPSDVLKEL